MKGICILLIIAAALILVIYVTIKMVLSSISGAVQVATCAATLAFIFADVAFPSSDCKRLGHRGEAVFFGVAISIFMTAVAFGDSRLAFGHSYPRLAPCITFLIGLLVVELFRENTRQRLGSRPANLARNKSFVVLGHSEGGLRIARYKLQIVEENLRLLEEAFLPSRWMRSAYLVQAEQMIFDIFHGYFCLLQISQ